MLVPFDLIERIEKARGIEFFTVTTDDVFILISSKVIKQLIFLLGYNRNIFF